jgi:DUF4097 and DUF4098 domain-containing protein YvlB
MQQAQRFSVQTHHGYINITGTDGNDCHIIANIRVQAESTEKANEIANRINIKLDNSQDKTAVIIDKPAQFQDYGVYVSYDIQLPRRTTVEPGTTHGKIECLSLTGNVTALTTHDPIICSDIHGNLNLNTTHAAIKLTDITGDVNARTTHDTIEAERIIGNCELNTSHGKVVCKEMNSPKLRIHTSHDNVEVSFKPDVKPEIETDITTSHGNIAFHVPPSFGGKVSMSTTHGKVKTQIPLTVTGEISENNLTGTIGTGTGAITLQTSFDNIHLK